jgi:hypothetical protein
MDTSLTFQHTYTHELPVHLRKTDIRLSEQVLEYFIQEFTVAGDTVFDPFAGYGTTLVSAQKLGRLGYGVEINNEWLVYAKSILDNPEHLILDDMRTADINVFPRFNFSISSPIYMHKHEQRDPLGDFKEPGTYEKYLNDLTLIYKRVSEHLVKDGCLVIEAANLKNSEGITTFAWDLCDSVAAVLNFQGEIVLNWDEYGYGYDHSYALVFKP